VSRSSFPCNELEGRFKTTKLVRFIIQDEISPFILLLDASNNSSWVRFEIDDVISLTIFIEDISNPIIVESLPIHEMVSIVKSL
jgi:hypothetical protein